MRPQEGTVLGELVGEAQSSSLLSHKSALEALWVGVAGRPSAVLLSFLYRVCTPHHQCPRGPGNASSRQNWKNNQEELQGPEVQELLPFIEREAADKERRDQES